MAKYLDIRWDLENNSFTVINPETQEPLQSSPDFPAHLQPVSTENVGTALMKAAPRLPEGECGEGTCYVIYFNGTWYWICG